MNGVVQDRRVMISPGNQPAPISQQIGIEQCHAGIDGTRFPRS
jgi:hypothetical protein